MTIRTFSRARAATAAATKDLAHIAAFIESVTSAQADGRFSALVTLKSGAGKEIADAVSSKGFSVAVAAASPAAEFDDQIRQAYGTVNCPHCNVHLSNGVIVNGDETGNANGEVFSLSHEFECAECGKGFGAEVVTEDSPSYEMKHFGTEHCPHCKIHLSNGVISDGDETGEGLGKIIRLSHEHECMACGGGFGAPVKAKAKTGKTFVITEKSTCDSPTKKVWEVADSMPGESRKMVIAACVEVGVAYSTARTQYQHWFRAQKAKAQ